MTETENADKTGAQNTDAGTQQNDAANAAANANAQDASQQQQANAAEKQASEKVIPDQYEFKLADDIKIDEEVATEFGALAKELKLDAAEAQKVAEVGGKLAQKWAQQQAEQVAATKGEWQNASRTDKEFGGDKLEANISVANKTFSAFGTPELRELLDKTGLGDHPEVIRWAYRVGQAISEDKIVTGDTAKKVEKDPASVMFPTMKSA